jgi:hypothetical protein
MACEAPCERGSVIRELNLFSFSVILLPQTLLAFTKPVIVPVRTVRTNDRFAGPFYGAGMAKKWLHNRTCSLDGETGHWTTAPARWIYVGTHQ